MEKEEFDLEQELVEVRARRIVAEQRRRKEIEETLLNYKLNRQRTQRNIVSVAVVGLAAAITAAGVIAISKLPKKVKDESTRERIEEMQNSETITMVRYYTVQNEDTLIGISKQTGISVEKLVADNNITNKNMINLGQTLRLNYEITPENYEYYTDTIKVGNRTIPDIAAEYNTSPVTICKLNTESIINHLDGTYTVMSETITVPKFITPTELQEAKNSYRR